MVEFIATLPERLRAGGTIDGSFAGTDRGRFATIANEWLIPCLAFLVVGLLLRGLTFGNPVIHIDEQFYLLVGDRMLHGALPFVDIWDRKPIGLFLLFAAIRELGGDGIIQYQLVAWACAAGTSLVIYRLARQIALPAGAFWAGVGYQLYLSAFFCFGGQAPVYYNLMVALAALGLCRAYTGRDTSRLFVNGLAMMMLIGIAIQIKYTVVFEGIAFGLALMARAWQAGWSRNRVLLAACGWAGIALVPTAAALAYYMAIGHGYDFIQANFLSIFGRHEDFLDSLWRLTKETLALTPVWLAIFLAPRRNAPVTGENPSALGFLRYWAGAAVLGFMVFGTWYDHYVAPLLVPLMAISAPALGRARPHRFYTVLLVGFGIVAAAAVTIYNTSHHGTREQVDRLTSLIRSQMGSGCVYINEGDPVLYLNTNSCFVTRYIFPNHLNGMVDTDSLGVNQNAEVARIMNRRPSVVVMTVEPSSLPVNWQGRHMIFDDLARDYQLVAFSQVGWRGFLIYRLKSNLTR